MTEGRIIKALSGFYYVMPIEDVGETVQCRGRGILKLKGETPLVGDRVMYKLTEHGEGVINELLPRHSELVRPQIANVDLAVLVFSIRQPELNLMLLDKFLAHTEQAGLETMICLSKSDLNGEEIVFLDEVIALYEGIGYEVIMTSIKEGAGLDELQQHLAGKTAVFSGQSGVGKSSLLNAMVPGLRLETGEVSGRIGRGKHTTRHVELVPLPNGGIVADTPGFSQLDFAPFEAEDLTYSFTEFVAYSGECKFRGCLHEHEPQCAIVAAVEEGHIAESRYKHYVLFLNEIKEKERRY